MYRLDCETFIWEKLNLVSGTFGGGFPEHRDSHSLVVIAGSLYLFGGKTHEPNEKVKNDLWMLLIGETSCEWKKIDTQGKSPEARESH